MNIQEEFEYWVDSLHEEGYDLSNYTWEGLFEYYCELLEVSSDEPGPGDDKIKAAAKGGTFFYNKDGPLPNAATKGFQDRFNDPKNKSLVLATTGGRTGVFDKNTNLFNPKDFTNTERQRFIRQGERNYNTQRSDAMQKLAAAKTPAAQSAAQSVMNTARDTGLAVWRQRYAGTSLVNKPTTSSASPRSQIDDIRRMSAASLMRQQNRTMPNGSIPTSSSLKPSTSAPGNERRVSPTLPNRFISSSGRALSAAEQRGGMREQKTYDFARPNRIARDMQYLYQSIYEDRDENLADNYPPYDKITRGDVLARIKGEDKGSNSRLEELMSQGMTRKEALAQIEKENKKVQVKESYDLDQLAILYLMQEGYAKDLRSAQAIYENASSEFKQNLQEIAPAIVAAGLRLAPLAARLAPAALRLARRAAPAVNRFIKSEGIGKVSRALDKAGDVVDVASNVLGGGNSEEENDGIPSFGRPRGRRGMLGRIAKAGVNAGVNALLSRQPEPDDDSNPEVSSNEKKPRINSTLQSIADASRT